MPDDARAFLEDAGYRIRQVPDLAKNIKRSVKVGKEVLDAIEKSLGTTVTRLIYVREDQEILVGLHYTDELANDGENDD